ncbi:glycosyltransferase, partial [Crocinitomix catalasitica]|nr:glycosyltransferase [Crocinitomix catalasitica]
MKISIITVAYNSADTIVDTIESVLSQKNIDLEYIVVDGVSTDKTMEIVQSYGDRIHRVISEQDKGIYDAMNKGVALASGDIVGILNSDDFYTSETVLDEVVSTFDDATMGVYGDLIYVDQKNTDVVKRKWISGEYVQGSFVKGWMPPHPTFFVRKEVYEKFGAYTLKLKSAADYEFMLRVIHKNEIPIKYLP